MKALYDLIQLFPMALACGLLMATVCSVIGVFVILKRVVFISIALSETAAFGIALGMSLGLPPLAGALAVTTSAVLLLSIDYESSRIPRDAVLGVVFLLTSSLSILLVAKSGFGLDEIKALMYGDLTLADVRDLYVLLLAGIPALAVVILFTRPIIYSFFDRDASRVMGIRCRFWEMLFFLILGLVVSTASKSGGALLVFCYLAVVPATALLLSRKLTVVLTLAPLIGCSATLGGLSWSYARDLPGNQAIIVASCAAFGVAALFSALVRRR